uniref:Spindle pole body component n=1 Tax=Bionectria ochroleuca TaxID=29856 RepID=A0A8H7TTM4_BIOOC
MSSGPARSSSRANGTADERPRVSTTNGSFRAERMEPGRKTASPQTSASYGSTTHKRTASGHHRNVSRSTEERRYEERRITERTIEAHVQRLVPRSTSTERQRPPVERKAPDTHRQKVSEGRSRAETPSAPWNPEASLVPHTTAPLASRISIAPIASAVPQAPQPKPLGTLTLEEQEAAVVADLLFVFMGYEGQYIRYAKGYNPNEERDRLSGPAFKIAAGMDPSLHDLAQSMVKMATYYSALEAFVDVQSREEFGAVNHALCASVRKWLQDYLIMIAQLETQFLTSDTFTVHVLNVQTISTCKMMQQLYELAQELLKRNSLLDDDDEEEEDSVDDYDDIIENLRDGGELVPGNMTNKKLCKGVWHLGWSQDALRPCPETLQLEPCSQTFSGMPADPTW